MINLTWQLFPINGSYYDPRVTGLITAIVVVAVVIVWGSRTLAHYSKVSMERRAGSLLESSGQAENAKPKQPHEGYCGSVGHILAAKTKCSMTVGGENPTQQLTATICRANQNHCHNIPQIVDRSCTDCLLSTGFWSRAAATICITGSASLRVKSQVHLHSRWCSIA